MKARTATWLVVLALLLLAAAALTYVPKLQSRALAERMPDATYFQLRAAENDARRTLATSMIALVTVAVFGLYLVRSRPKPPEDHWEPEDDEAPPT